MTSPFPLGALPRLILAVLLLACNARGQFVIPGPELRMNGFVFALESDASGNVYLGGSFNEFNGDSSSGLGLLRLTPGGAKHATWDIGFIDGVSDLRVQGDFLYVAGSFTTVRTISAGTISRTYLMRIFLTGANEGKIDTSWTPLPNGPVSKIDSDGTSLFLAGVFSDVNGTPRTRLAKLALSNAALDGTWNPVPNNAVGDIEFADGKLYVSGGFTSIGAVASKYLARLSLTGAGGADAAWLPDIDRPVGELESANSFVYFGGDFTQVQGINHRSVGRVSTAAGAVAFDGTWKPDPNGEVSGIAISGSDLYMSGVFTTVGGANRRFMAKVSASGTGGLDGSFLPEPNGAIQELKMVGGNVLAGGRFNTTNGVASAGYALMSSSTGAALAGLAGTVSTEGEIYSMQEVSGAMIIGGLFDTVNGVPRTSIAKILSNGTLDGSFNVPLVGFNRLVSDMKIDGANLYFCGDFLTAGGAPTKHVARVNASTGAVDAGWFTTPLTPILCLETDANYVYIGSAGLRFIEVSPGNAFQVFNLARLSKGGAATVDTFWTPAVGDQQGNPANASVNDLQINGTKLLIGGKFAFIANPSAPETDVVQRIGVASLTTTPGWGQPDAGWATEFYDEFGDLGSIHQLLLHNSSLYVAGNFVTMDSPTQAEDVWIGVARLNSTNGGWIQGFDVSPAIYDGVGLIPGSVATIAASGSFLYVAGDFDYTWNNTPPGGYFNSPYIVRVNQNTGVPDLSWYPYPNDSVSIMAFAGSNLWMFGSFDMVGDTFVEGPAIIAPYTSTYQTWLNAYFTPAQIANSDYTAPFMDLDDDGDSNLVEATFNTNPLNPKKTYHTAGSGTSGLPLIRMEVLGGQQVTTIEYTRWKASANAGVSVMPQFGDNLATWPRAGTMIGTATSLSTTRERVKFQDSTGNLPKAFGRVRVDAQTP